MNILISLIITFLLSGFVSEKVITVGDDAPDFTLKNVDGTMVSLSDYDEVEGIILTFTCNTCPFSVKYEDRIIELDNTYRSMGFPVVAINPNDVNIKPGDSFEEMVVRAEEKAFPFEYLYDETQEVAAAYNAARTPHVYILQRVEGKFVIAYIGAIDNNVENPADATEMYVENSIQAMKNGDMPNPSLTKAIGCTIKWKVQ